MTTTEIELRGGATVAVTEAFRLAYPSIAPDAAMVEMLAEALGDVELTARDLPTSRVPSGGSLLWKTVVNGKEAALGEIKGIISHVKKQRVFWSNPDPSNSPPDCASSDGIVPDSGGMYAPDGERAAQNPSGQCKRCPMSQKLSDLKGGRGAACKEQRLVFLAQEGKQLPTVVVVPPSSIKSLQTFIIDLVNDGRPWWSVKVILTLEEAVNAAGIKFGRIIVKADGALEEGEVQAVRAYGEYIKDLVIAANVADYTSDASDLSNPEGGMKVGNAG